MYRSASELAFSQPTAATPTLQTPTPGRTRGTLNALLTALLVLTLLLCSPALSAKDDPSQEPTSYGLVVDGRAMQSFILSASGEGVELGHEEVIALLWDETVIPDLESVTSFAHDEDFPALGTEVEMHRDYTVIKGLADLAAESASPWGVRFPLTFEGLELQVEVKVRQRLDEYLAVFVDDLFPGGKMSSPEALAVMAEREAEEVGGELLQVYDHVVGGFMIRLPFENLKLLHKSIKIKWVEPNVYVHQTTLQAGLPNWALDRVDERFTPLDNKYDYGHDGSGVTVFVLDTGIRLTHNEFGNRASNGTDYISTVNTFPHCGTNGHGSFMASLAAGEKWGVAKGADLVAMRVLNCAGNGDIGDLTAALDDIRALKVNDPNRPMVASLSLSSDSSSAAIDTAVTQAVNAGVVVVVSANSLDQDACDSSPAGAAAAITVGAVTKQGDRWTSNNNGSSDFGTCIDIWSPGKDVRGAHINLGNNDAQTGSGTSPAAALVAGMAARYLSVFPAATPATVAADLDAAATTGVLSGLGAGSPDRLLFWDEEDVPGVVYRSHVKNFAWLTWVSNGAMTGSTNQGRRAEAFQIKLNDLPSGIGICYEVDSRSLGWTGTQCDGATAGTTSQNKRAERIKIWLTGSTAAGCSVEYRVHSANSGWQSMRSNGAVAGTDGVRIEALEVSLTPQCMLPPPPPPPTPPVANCTAMPNHGMTTVHATLDASGSYDPGGSALTYQWNLGLGTAVTVNHTFTNSGNAPAFFPVTVTVTNLAGGTDTDICPVLVECPSNNPPCIQ